MLGLVLLGLVALDLLDRWISASGSRVIGVKDVGRAAGGARVARHEGGAVCRREVRQVDARAWRVGRIVVVMAAGLLCGDGRLYY